MSSLEIDLGRGLLFHDSLVVRGGAERVMTQLAQSLPIHGWCVAQWDPQLFPIDLLNAPVHSLGVNASTPVWRTLAGLRAFRQAPLLEPVADWAIFSGFNAPAAVHQRMAQRSILYCHALPRFAYDLEDFYSSQLSLWQRPAFKAFNTFVRYQFERAIHSMDFVLANSINVQRRLQTFLGLSATVLNPPVPNHRFHWEPDQGYFLSTARLEDFKRVDRIIRAFQGLPEHRLVVTSDGRQRAALEALARGHSNISFTGALSDFELVKTMAQALATIYIPIDEDFGLSPVESMSAGKPVLGVAEGGLLETIVPNETGWLLSADPSVEEIRAGIQSIQPETARSMKAACQERARLFDLPPFIQGIQNAIVPERN